MSTALKRKPAEWETTGLCLADDRHEDGDPTPHATDGDLCEACAKEDRRRVREADLVATAAAANAHACTFCMVLVKREDVPAELLDIGDGCKDCQPQCGQCESFDDVRDTRYHGLLCEHCRG